MSTMVVTTRVTHRYLMNKTKWDLATWIMDDFDKIEELQGNNVRFNELLDEMTADRDSETRWAKYYSDLGEKLTAENTRLREALERFANIDLTLPVDPKIVYDILHARAALEEK